MSDDMLAQFVVKNLDSGESFNVSKVPTFLQKTQVNTFGNTAYKFQDFVTTIVESVNESYTSYEIAIFNKQSEARWEISRRYNEFVALQARLKETGSKIPEDLPPKTWLASQAKVIKSRRLTLERWLNLVVACVDPKTNPYLAVFLEIYRESEVQLGKAMGKLGRNFFSGVVDSTFTNERVGGSVSSPSSSSSPTAAAGGSSSSSPSSNNDNGNNGEPGVVDIKGKRIAVNRLNITLLTLGQGAKKYPHLAKCKMNTNLTLRADGTGGSKK